MNFRDFRVRRVWPPVAALAVAAALVGSACGVATPAANPAADGARATTTQPTNASSTDATTLTVWYFDKVSMDTVIPLFEQTHPGVKVNFVEQPFGDMSKKYLAALAAKQGVPDVIGLDTSMVGQFLDAGENLLAEPYNAGQLKRDFVQWKFDAP